VLNRLAGDATQRLSLKDVQAALLHRLPPGTPRPTVIAYLEAHDIIRDRFEGGQWLRYQDQGRVILGLISDPPWQLTLFCTGSTYYVRFYFDDAERLHDILVENQIVCL
jgi:hypothetical protein